MWVLGITPKLPEACRFQCKAAYPHTSPQQPGPCLGRWHVYACGLYGAAHPAPDVPRNIETPFQRKSALNKALGAWGMAGAGGITGVVSKIAARDTPFFINKDASRRSNGPLPASTTRPEGFSPASFVRLLAAPAPITPERVQPGMGTGRSMAPVATS